MAFLDDVAARHAEDRRHWENSARLAQSYGVYVSRGQGSYEFRELFKFGLTFVEEPRMHYGSKIDLDALGDLQNNEPGDTPIIPHSTGFVTAWDRDNRGCYTGCNVGVRVSFNIEDLVAVTLQVRVEHHFTFSGIAMKDVPVELRD